MLDMATRTAVHPLRPAPPDRPWLDRPAAGSPPVAASPTVGAPVCAPVGSPAVAAPVTGSLAAGAPRRRLGYRPAFDGVRGIAWLVVFAAHAGLLRPFAAGQVAMFVFFALSGFLITELLLEERQAHGSVSLRRFFARRALRLLPALGLFLAGWLAVVLVAGGHAGWTSTVPSRHPASSGTSPLVGLEGVAAAAGYLTNWLTIAHGFTGYVPLGHLWSLAVEEQFYLLWAPLAVLLLAFGGRRLAGWAAAALATGSFLDVALLHGGHGISLAVDMGTDTRAGAFLAGAALAAWWSAGHPALDALAGRLRPAALTAVLAVLAFAAWSFDHPRPTALFVATWVAISLASGLLVLCLLGPPAPDRRSFLSGPLLTYLGRRSYALYLWHYVWLTWFHDLGRPGVLLALAASLASAELSWRLVERPALACKARFAVRPPVAGAGAGAGAGAVAVAFAGAPAGAPGVFGVAVARPVAAASAGRRGPLERVPEEGHHRR